MPSVVLIADLDSQLFGAMPFAKAFRSAGWQVALCIPSKAAIPAVLMAEIEAEFQTFSLEIADVPHSAVIQTVDAVGVFATGSRIAQFRETMHVVGRLTGRRPFLFTGYNGLVYEKYEEGIFWRLGYDVICLNGPRDKLIFDATLGGSPYAAQPTVMTGLHRPVRSHPPRGDRRKTMVFAEQVAAPATAPERDQLFALLEGAAEANPDWTVVVRPRIAPHEQTFHKIVLHPEALKSRWPSNMMLSYRPLGQLLGEADLLCTLSSTAVFDAMDAGVPFVLMSDFGIRTAIGTHFFATSGAAVSFAGPPDLDDFLNVAPSPEWLRHVGASPDCTIDNLVTLVTERLDSGHADQPAPPSSVLFPPGLREPVALPPKPKGKPAESKAIDVFPTPRPSGFQQRLAGYGPVRRVIVRAGDAILPDAVSRPIDRFLRRIKVL